MATTQVAKKTMDMRKCDLIFTMGDVYINPALGLSQNS